MLNLTQITKKRIFKIYIKQLFLFIISVLVFGAGAYAESSVQNPQTYNITLPQKVEGIKKLEYMIDNSNMGGVSGQNNVNLANKSVLNFLIQVEPENYNNLRVKDIKIHSQTGQTLNLMRYMYDKDGNLTKVALPENDIIDSNQTYVTSDYNVFYNDVLSLNELPKDSFKAAIKLDSDDYLINDALSVLYGTNKEDPQNKPIYNSTDNSFEITNITVNTPLKIKLTPSSEFSQSEIEVFNNEEKLIISSDNTITIPAVDSNLNIIVKNIHKNRYNLTFENYEDLKFEYKNHDSDDPFKSASLEPINIISGENYDFKCTSLGEDILEGKEITANNVALKSVNGVYSILNINEDTNISVNSKEESYYQISLPDNNSGVSVIDEGGTPVTYGKSKFGENFKFKIKANEGYTRNITDALIYAVPTDKLENGNYDTEKNNEEASSYLLTPSYSDVYTISDVKQPISIIVKNLERDSYKVTFPEKLIGVSYKVTTSQEVKELSDNSFSVTYGAKMFVTLEAKDGKSIENASIGCSTLDILVTKNGNQYTIENITDDINLAINEVEDKQCKITFDSEGVICKDENGHVLSQDNIVTDYKGSIKFSLALKEGYKTTSDIELSIKSGNAKLTKLSSENFYELSNVIDNTVISIKGIEKEQVVLNLSSGGGSAVFTSTESGEPLTGLNKVDYGSDISFTVTSSNDSDQQYTVTSSNENTDLESIDNSTNTFVLRNISGNTTLSASPVFASSYDVSNNASETRGAAEGAADQPQCINVGLFKEKIKFQRTINSFNDNINFTFSAKEQNSSTLLFKDSNNYGIVSTYGYIDSRTRSIPLLKTSDYTYTGSVDLEFTIEADKCPHISIINQNNTSYLQYKNLNGELTTIPFAINGQGITFKQKQNFDFNNLVMTIEMLTDTYKVNITNVSVSNYSHKSTLSMSATFTLVTNELTDAFYKQFPNDQRFQPNPFFIEPNICFSPNSKYSDANIQFQNSDGNAVFTKENGDSFIENTETTRPEQDLIFKLQCYPYMNFTTTDSDPLIHALTVKTPFHDGTASFDDNKQVYIIRPPNASETNYDDTISYKLEILSIEPDGSCITFKISKIAASYNRWNLDNEDTPPAKLSVSVNTNLITRRYFQCEFTGYNVQYFNEDETLPFTSQQLRINEVFTFKPLPSVSGDTSDNNIEFIHIIIDDEIYNYVFPVDEGDSTASSLKDKLTISSERKSGKLIIKLSDIATNFKFITKYKRKEINVTFNSDGLFRYKILTPSEHQDETWPADNSASDSIKIKYGQTLSFVVDPAEGVDISDITVMSNGAYVNMTNGKYTIKSISDPQDIRATGAHKLKYNITFTQYDYIFFKDINGHMYNEQQPVEHGNSIDFRVTVSDAYSKHIGDIKVFAECASGKILTTDSNAGNGLNDSNGTTDSSNTDSNEPLLSYDAVTNNYQLINVNQPIRIYVNNIEPNDYNITLQLLDGIEYYNQYGTEKFLSNDNNQTIKTTIRHGENFSFKVVAKEGYDISNLKIYDKAGINGVPSQLLSAHDVYTINNVTDDHMVTAQNLSRTKCTLEFRSLPGTSCLDNSGNTFENRFEVDYGSNYEFKLSLDAAYNKSNPTVNIKGVTTPLQKNSDGIYTISNIQEDKIIEISNVTKNSYTATFKDAEGVIYKTAKNKPFTGTQPVEYEGSLYFKISLMDAYDKSTPLVLMDDTKVLGENSGVYCISNIHDDVVVTVKNVVKNPEEVEISDIANISTEVSSESDIDDVVRATQTYMNLSDEDKEQVTNIDDLKKAQANAGNINHSSNGVEISGIDWNIKILVTPLSEDEEQMKKFSEKVDRRSLFSLYEIHLIDVMTGNNYEVPFGQKVSVILPAPNLSGCTNAVVAHEKAEGNMEYLDLNIVDNKAQFETSSFSMFGIAAKKIQNYVENPSDMKISVDSLVENEEELKSLLGEGLVSQLGSLLDDSKTSGDAKDYSNNLYSDDSTSSDLSDNNSSGIRKLFNKLDLENTYNWLLDNELLSVILILLIGTSLIWLLLFLARKKGKNKKIKK